VNAEEEAEAIKIVKKKIAASSHMLGGSSGFRVESATEIMQIPPK